jgi:FdhE protein
MAQRILEPGEIETLASRDVPRIILPDIESLFAERATRLRSLAAHSAIGGYLQLLAALADAQQALLDELTPQQREALQSQARAQQSSAAAGAGMPLRPANTLQLDGCWRDWLRTLCQHCADEAGLPAETRQELQRVAAADDAWLDAQAHAVLERDDAPSVDAVAALLVMNALQVYWAVLAASFRPTDLKPLADAPGLCPLCGTLPVTSVVQARHPMRPTVTCRARCAPASGTTCACSAASVVPPARTSPIAPWPMWTATAARRCARARCVPRPATTATATARSCIWKRTRHWSRWPMTSARWRWICCWPRKAMRVPARIRCCGNPTAIEAMTATPPPRHRPPPCPRWTGCCACLHWRH